MTEITPAEQAARTRAALEDPTAVIILEPDGTTATRKMTVAEMWQPTDETGVPLSVEPEDDDDD